MDRRKRRVQQFSYFYVYIHYRCNVLTKPLPSNDKEIFTDPLASNCRGYAYRHTDWRERLKKCAFGMGSDAIIHIHMYMYICICIYILFHKDWFRHSEVYREESQTRREHGDRIRQLYFFLIRKVSQKQENPGGQPLCKNDCNRICCQYVKI
jgi:hypothetical protein